MTQPRYAHCKCGHPRAGHPDEFEEACAVPNCMCQEYIPSTLRAIEMTPVVVASAPTAAQRIAAPQAKKDGAMAELDALLATARQSPFKRTVNLASKIDGLLNELRERVETEAEQASTMREIAELEARLAAKRAELRGTAKVETAEPTRERTLPCPECTEDGEDKTFVNAAGLGAHRFRAHGIRSERAS